MQIMAEIKIRTEEILLQCRYAGVISLSGPTYTEVGIVCPEDSPSGEGGGRGSFSARAFDTCFGKHAIA